VTTSIVLLIRSQLHHWPTEAASLSSKAMKWLWLTLADPEPAENGQLLYSRGIIQALARAGIELDVIGLARPGGRHVDGQQTGSTHWWLAPHDPPSRWASRWASLASELPAVARQNFSPSMRELITGFVEQDGWDAIVFDSIASGWALETVLRRYHGVARPPIVYIAHNHEESVAETIANAQRHPIKRPLKRRDARKVQILERSLSDTADLIASNAFEDAAKFLARRPDKQVLFLPPAYDGRHISARTIGPALPRRAVVVGTFDWLPKRMSLEGFLSHADTLLAANGVELHVVGRAEDDLLNRWRARFPATKFTGRVPEVASHMAAARLALVPDTLGGFKLKALDYVFNRLPILAIDGSVPGTPLVPGKSILLYPDHATLARGVLEVIDDFSRLNALQEQAYVASRSAFDSATLAQRLIDAVSGLAAPGMPAEARESVRVGAAGS
jgi:polysaccharide biosynthesis protein PslH